MRIEEECKCGKLGIFIGIITDIFRKEGYYNNDTNTQYCKDCWKSHCNNVREIKNRLRCE